jgi:predicted phosphodiesterase
MYNMKNNLLLFFLLVPGLLLPLRSAAQIQQTHLSWNIADKHATENTMAVTWSATHLDKGLVKYNTNKSLLKKQTAIGTYSDSAKIFIYKATLKNLKPNTTYYYKCGSDKDGWSDTFSFTTAPPLGSKTKFVVGVWGDTQDNEFNELFQKTDVIVKQLKKYPIQFTVHMGDIVDNGAIAAKWKGLFNTAEPVNANAPFMPVTGNHDVQNNPKAPDYQKPFSIFHEFLNLPGNSLNYSYNYGNTHFVAISSGHAKGAEPVGDFTFAPGSVEYKWLEKDLSDARKDKNVTWIILYLHHPLYSFGWSHVVGWQNRITPLVDKYKVDLCLAGHRHVYERHTAIRDTKVVPQVESHLYQKPQGTVYVTNGTSGGSPQGLGGGNMPSMVFTNATKMYNYAIMSIDGNAITYDVYNEKGDKIDYFKLTK